jgi:hypothetical protein
MPSFQLDALIDDADDDRARVCVRVTPLALLPVYCSVHGRITMRKLMESVLLVLARIRRLITGPR